MTSGSVIIAARGLLVPTARPWINIFGARYCTGAFGGHSVPMSGKPASWEDTY